MSSDGLSQSHGGALMVYDPREGLTDGYRGLQRTSCLRV